MKFLESPMQTMAVGFGLAVVLIMGYLAMAGMPVGDADWFGLLLRWAHFLAGIVWIGLLYFFNLINAAFLKSLDGPTKNIVIPKLMPAALNWFRHGATITVLAGIVLYLYIFHRGGTGAIAVGIGGLLGIIMMANVHAVIWPNQRKIIAAVTAAAQGTPAPPEMAQWGRTALLASRINFMLSIPMLLFMGAGSHLR
ncbi:MAG TPA: urate hydroxylase PuuD [Nitrospiraceae bacterium]|nr:urate hydroxylase PuuD [Nitrospiraceae bacterium]